VQIVIDIPEDRYRQIKDMPNAFGSDICKAIRNGIPLPKGHGKLVDEKEAMGLIAEGKNGKAYFGTVNKDWEVIDFLKTIPPIIEADEETENEHSRYSDI